MKKTFKIIGISLAALLGLIIITLTIVLWLIVTPEKLTPIVRNQTEKFILCTTDFDTVDVTFFSTFPNVGLRIKNLALINPIPGAPSDTLAFVEDLKASLNIKELLFNNALKIKAVTISNVDAHLFIDANGNTNFDIVEIDTTEEDTTFELPFDLINLHKINIKNLNADFTDNSSGLFASINNMTALLKGELTVEDAWAKLKMESGAIRFNMKDSVPITAKLSSFETKIEGKKSGPDISGDIFLDMPEVFFRMDTTDYAKGLPVSIEIPFTFRLSNQKITFDEAEIALKKFKLFLNGNVQPSADFKDIDIDMAFNTNTWNIPQVLEIVPEIYKEMLNDIKVDGELALKGNAKGRYNDSLIPIVTANILLEKGKFAYKKLNLPFKNISADLLAHLDLNNDSLSMVNINALTLETGKSNLMLSGQIMDLLNKMIFKININSNMDIVDIKPVLPADMNLQIKGKAKTNMLTDFAMHDMQNLDLQKLDLNGSIQLIDLEAVYNDSIFVNSPDATLKISSDKARKNKLFNELYNIEIISKDMDVKMIDVVDAVLKDVKLKAQVSDFMDTTKLISAHCDFDFGSVDATMDTITALIQKASGSVTMIPSKKNKKNPDLRIDYQSSSIAANLGQYLHATTGNVSLNGKALLDDTQKDKLLQWSPELKVNLRNAKLQLADLSVPVEIPMIVFDFTPEKFVINQSQLILDESNFKLSGEISHIDQYLNKTGLLKGNLRFVSDNTNINQIMDIVSGFGASDSALAAEETESKEDNPFMVPLGIDMELYTWIKNATVGKTTIQNVEGNLTVKDGVMVLEEIGFTSEAAKMQLTAIYRSPRKNHLFAGIDFHLLDVDIKALINMIPEIDTLVPMLKSFAGKAEFHLAAETYLKSNYELKMSTLRASAALEGQDLVLIDNETFTTISKYLMFNKKTENKVDSLSVEMTVFKNEIELFPFQIVMDKYKAVIRGLHNLDMTFDYHISITDSPLPTRLGLNVKGNIGNLEYNLVPCEFPNMYRPGKQKAVEKRVLELKGIISDALKENVKR